MVYGIFCGLLCSFAVPSILRVLLFTNRSTNPTSAYKRFKRNIMHIYAWYQYDLKPETKAWKSIQDVRTIHYKISKNSSEGGAGIISQKDMVLTQLAFMGFSLSKARFLGIRGTYEQFDAFAHLWRVLGHLLGIEERFNLCAETLEGTLSRIEAVTSQIIVPALKNVDSDFYMYSKSAFEGIWCFNPEINFEATLLFTRRFLGISDYRYFEGESRWGDATERVYKNASLYAKFRFRANLLIYQYLTKYFVVRWTLNLLQIFVTKFLEYFPVLAIYKFGKKHAYVKIVEHN